jgi:hypothetical protein
VQLGFGVLSDVVIEGLRVRQTVQEELSLTSHSRHCHRCPMPDIICIACVSTALSLTVDPGPVPSPS